MKKIFLSGVVIAAFFLYSVFRRIFNSPENPNPPTPSSNTSTIPLAPPPTLKNNAALKDGTYTGDVFDAFYGNVQVRAVINGGKITAVNFLQYPNDRATSREINSQAMPVLQSEAIQAQQANVDIVSGATDTSQAFISSLQSALVKAQ